MGPSPATSAQGHESPACRFLPRQPPSPCWRTGTARMLTVPSPASWQSFKSPWFSLVTALPAGPLSSPTPLKPSLNHIPGRKLISPTPLCCFPTKSRESDCFIGDMARPEGTCIALYCLKLRRPAELLSSPDSGAGSAEGQNLPLVGSNVDSDVGHGLLGLPLD